MPGSGDPLVWVSSDPNEGSISVVNIGRIRRWSRSNSYSDRHASGDDVRLARAPEAPSLVGRSSTSDRATRMCSLDLAAFPSEYLLKTLSEPATRLQISSVAALLIKT